MKYTLAILMAAVIGTVAYAGEAAKTTGPVPVVAANKEEAKKAEEPKTKKVCIETKDAKGNPKTICKTMKVHEKHEGTKVPDGKKK